jgi:hypothetical protein
MWSVGCDLTAISLHLRGVLTLVETDQKGVTSVYVQKDNKASPFAGAAVLKNPINGETVLCKIKTLWGKN